MWERATQPEPHLPDATAALRVLLIDDDALVRETCADLLRAFGFAVVTCESGGAALDDAGRYDAILCDYQLPDLDGVTLAAHLRDRHPETPILLLTGWDQVTSSTAVTAVLQKPILPRELVRTLRTFIRTPDAPGTAGPIA